MYSKRKLAERRNQSKRNTRRHKRHTRRGGNMGSCVLLSGRTVSEQLVRAQIQECVRSNARRDVKKHIAVEEALDISREMQSHINDYITGDEFLTYLNDRFTDEKEKEDYTNELVFRFVVNGSAKRDMEIISIETSSR